MSTYGSINACNICPNNVDRGISALECSPPDHLCLDGFIYCFYHRGIVAVFLAAHRWNDAVYFGQSAIRITGILTPTVYVLDQSRPGLPEGNGFVHSTDGKRFIRSRASQPTLRREYRSTPIARYCQPWLIQILDFSSKSGELLFGKLGIHHGRNW